MFFGEHAIVVGIAAAVSALGFLSGIGSYEMTSKIGGPPQPVSMALKSMEFRAGRIETEFYITGADILAVDWATEIERGREQLCSSSGTSPFQNENPKSFSPDDWAGQFEGDCGTLEDGDHAVATWSYETKQGTLVSLSGAATISIE